MTMMSMIMERRKEIGLKKALGASDKKLLTEFLVEGGIIGFLGSTLGILLSYYFAMLIGKMVFDAEISFRFAIVPWLYISSFVVIGTAFMFSLRRIAEIEPALVLKGE
jgi:putative ABC transport system permease protein